MFGTIFSKMVSKHYNLRSFQVRRKKKIHFLLGLNALSIYHVTLRRLVNGCGVDTSQSLMGDWT